MPYMSIIRETNKQANQAGSIQMNDNSQAQTFDHTATFSPQDNKLRLFFGYRLDKPEWDRLKRMGFTWTMKQASDMVATWTPEREDAALELAGEVGDEDQPREERAADRAERFEGYGDNAESRAVGSADKYDAGPGVYAHQSAARAARVAARFDRVAGRAVSDWSKAEYWTRRTAGVVANALYLERADVRFRRMKGYESDMRKLEAEYVPSKVLEGVEAVTRYCGEKYAAEGHDCVGMFGLGRGRYARSYAKATGCGYGEGSRAERWMNHYRLLLAYERQMLDAQGGAGVVEVEVMPGGFFGSLQVQKVSKDAEGRVSKVYFYAPTSASFDRKGKAYDETNPKPLVLCALKAEKMKTDSYRAPTADELTAFKDAKKEANKGKTKAPPLLNPSLAEAQRLQDMWNAAAKAEHDARPNAKYLRDYEPSLVLEVTQAKYSELSGGSYSPFETSEVRSNGTRRGNWRTKEDCLPVVCRVRTASPPSDGYYGPRRVMVLTDKPQTSLPAFEVVAAKEAVTVA